MRNRKLFVLVLLAILALVGGQVQGQNAPEQTSPEQASLTDSSLDQTNLNQASPGPFPYQENIGVVHVFADFPFSEITELKTDIEELQDDLINYLGVPRPQEEVHLLLFADARGYLRYIHDHWPSAPLDRPALYIKDKGPGTLLIRKDDQLLLNIRHEMTHAILNASLIHVPIWLDEGLAKYFEIPRGKRGNENPFLKTVRQNTTFLFFSKAPSLERLERLYDVQQMGVREYWESWSWVHFLIHDSQETHYLLAGYLASLSPEHQQGITMEQALKIQKSAPLTAILKEQLPNYKKEYITHFKNWEQK